MSLSANPSTIASGASSTLTWSSTNATSCTASGAWSGSKALSGSQSTGALTATSTYSLTCTGAGGSAAQSATVTVSSGSGASVSLSANPSTIASGASSTLTWSSTNATSCTASGAWSGSKALSGSQSTGALTATSTYTLTCTGAGGSAAQSATVAVSPVRTGAAPTSWSIGCLDNQCISITDSRLTAGQSFLLSTLSASGAALGSYGLTADAANTIRVRPASYGELTALNDGTGLTIGIAASGSGPNPNIKFVALKTVTGFSRAPGSSNLLLSLNTNSLVQSPSYSIEFLDSTQKSLQTLTGLTPADSALTVDLSALQPSVAAAYNGNGIYVVLTNSRSQALPGAYYTNASDIGALNDFYSATQLQGETALYGANLLNIKNDLGFLLSPNVDVPYIARFANEVPFAHTLSITRFLGGHTLSAVKLLCTSNEGTTTYASYCTPSYNPASLDYVVNTGGSFKYQTALMLDRISPYINAGYSPSDITLVFKNVPWAMASNVAPQSGSACIPQSTGGSLGQYGQCNPPASYTQWGTAITRLATDLLNTYQTRAEQFNFAIGDEYDQTSNFNGQPTDFYSLYENAYKSLKSVLPAASVAAGDFTGACYNSASTSAPGCVYDSRSFFSREVAGGATPTYVARSLNLFWDMNPTSYPSAAVSTAMQSYTYVAAPAQTPFEMHQFGFLHMPWGATGGTMVSSIQANWEFQTLMGLKKNLPSVSRVFNWGGVATIMHGTPIGFLEGAGYVRIIMDNHQGAELYMLPVTSGSLPAGNEVMAIAMVEGNSLQIIVSNTDVVATNSNLALMQPHAPIPISITIPASWLGTTSWSYLRYSQAMVDNVFAHIKKDFANAGILDPHFAECAICFSDPLSMATDAAAARTILMNNWTTGSNYVQTMQNALKWNAVTSVNAADQLNIDQNGVVHAFSQSGGTLNVTVGPNEMLVLKPN